jgi:hypothetical protein
MAEYEIRISRTAQQREKQYEYYRNKLLTFEWYMSKKSIRFFNDREVRAVWDDENNKDFRLIQCS